MSQKTLALLHRRLKPVVIRAMSLAAPPPKKTRFGGKFASSRLHWVRPEQVAEITYPRWVEDGLLRHTVFVASRRARPGARSPREHAKRLHVSRAICRRTEWTATPIAPRLRIDRRPSP